VLQEPFLYSRTIRDNIAAVDDDNRAGIDEHIQKAARIACIDDAVTAFSQGYDTMVGERGVTLSGGQKQRVAISRTLIRHTPVVIFDDSLSAVDTETDAKIRSALRGELDGTTVIIITHRVTSLMNADKILVLDKGKAAGFGTHEVLMETCALYREIYQIQQAGAVEASHTGGDRY
jgi:ATP-binding cassette subfamily B protein